jgi:hypothetical protein
MARAAMVLLLVSGGAIVNIAVAWGITLGHGSVNDVHKLSLQVLQANRRALRSMKRGGTAPTRRRSHCREGSRRKQCAAR